MLPVCKEDRRRVRAVILCVAWRLFREFNFASGKLDARASETGYSVLPGHEITILGIFFAIIDSCVYYIPVLII